MPQPEASPMAPQRVRPTGVTILAVLNAILSMFGVLGGLISIIAIPFLGEFMPAESMGMGFGGMAMGVLLGVIGGFFLIFGVVGLVVTVGMLSGKSWAWWLTIIFSVIGVISGLISLPVGLFNLIMYGVILYYFTRPHVKIYFGQKPITVTV